MSGWTPVRSWKEAEEQRIVDLKNLRRKHRIPLGWKILAWLLLCYAVAGTVDFAAAKVSHRILLETSSQPATLDECQRSFPGRGRPREVISLQNGADSPWHHRTCFFDK